MGDRWTPELCRKPALEPGSRPVRARAFRFRFALAPVLAAWLSVGAAADAAQPTLPTVTLRAGMHLIKAEVADRDESRMRGLMHRSTLAANHGMLFVFPAAARQCFWMRNTPLPLSIAFIDERGEIVNIADMSPFSEESHCSAKPVAFALEMTQGWFARRGLKPGTRISNPEYFGR